MLKGVIVATGFALIISCSLLLRGSYSHLLPGAAVDITGKASADFYAYLDRDDPGMGILLILLLVLSASMSSLSSLVLV